MSEKRAHERMGVVGDVAIKTMDPRAQAIKACLENISFGGFGVLLQENIEPQSEFDFEMNISTAGEFFRGKGIIRYSIEKMKYNNKVFISGAEFNDIDKDVLTYIIKKVQAKIARQKGANTQGASFIPF